MAPFSNHGGWVEACAVGEDLHSTYLETETTPGPDIETAYAWQWPVLGAEYNGYARWSGSSFAAGVVSGAIARVAGRERKKGEPANALTAWKGMKRNLPRVLPREFVRKDGPNGCVSVPAAVATTSTSFAPLSERIEHWDPSLTAQVLSWRNTPFVPRAEPDGSRAPFNVVLANPDSVPDAALAAPLATRLGYGTLVLFVDNDMDVTDLSHPTLYALDWLMNWHELKGVFLAGGEQAISPSLEEKIGQFLRERVPDDMPRLHRIGGSNAFRTAREVAKKMRRKGVSEHVYLVGPRSGSWIDALSVSGLAALRNDPILLSESGRLPKSTRAALQEAHVKRVTIVGDRRVVSRGVQRSLTRLGIRTRRIGRGNRYTTSAAIARQTVAEIRRIPSFEEAVNGVAERIGLGASESQANLCSALREIGEMPCEALLGDVGVWNSRVYDGHRVWVIPGDVNPVSMVAGLAAARELGVLLLVDGEDLRRSPATARWLRARKSNLQVVRPVGGSAAIRQRVVHALRRL